MTAPHAITSVMFIDEDQDAALVVESFHDLTRQLGRQPSTTVGIKVAGVDFTWFGVYARQRAVSTLRRLADEIEALL